MKKNAVCLVSICIVISGVLLFYFKNNKSTEAKQEDVVQKQNIDNSKEETLEEINKYQERYFNIIKRNDVLLNVGEVDETNKDSSELEGLFNEVENKISKNNEYLKEYKKLEEKFKENTGNTTFEIDEFEKKKYDAFDKLLNDTYKALKNELGEDEFEKLKLSQRAWLKEVEEYNKVFESKGFGTIAGLVKAEYEINMRSFRTLLLMLYLDNNATQLSDYLGQWAEVSAGRIYVDIKNKGNKVEVKYGGANSAYSHSETVYDCKYDKASGDLICDSAKHTDQFMSCNGISSDDDLDGFLNCTEKYPNKEKDDYKTYSDNKTTVLKIKKGNKSHYIVDDEEYLSDERKEEVRKNYENMGLYFKEDKETVFYKYKE